MYFLLALAMAELIRVVLHQVVENVKMLALNLVLYKSSIQSELNRVSEMLHMEPLDVSKIYLHFWKNI